MKIKGKLVLGIGVLFVMITLLTVIGSIFINKLSTDTSNILAANYNTIEYSRNMLIALNKGVGQWAQSQLFEENLKKQQQNVTEVGEQSLTYKLITDFNALKNTANDTILLRTVHRDITDIMLLNMQAIKRKSDIARKTSEHAVFWIEAIGCICFVISLTLLFNLPSNIANPIRELTESIKQIAAQNYSQRVHFEGRDEFAALATSFNTMAQKLEEYQSGNMDKILTEKRRVEALIDNMREPVIGLDADHRIVFFNNNALTITGLKLENVIGRPVQDVSIHNDLLRTLIQDLFWEENHELEVPVAPITIYTNNKESYFEKEIIPIWITPTGERQERKIGNVIMLKNVTEYKELDSAKTNFIATVSHEFKTPISSIKMSLQLLEKEQIGKLNEEQKKLVESINDDSDRLLKITGELLNISQVESGSIHLNVFPTEVSVIIEYAVNANRVSAAQKSIKFKINQSSSAQYIMADMEKTAWVLNNLISNAIRYSYENSIILIEALQYEDRVSIAVTDYGQGIAPEYLSRIFERYFKIPGSKKEGTGLGLSISKEFMAAQYGAMNVRSELGGGSTFSIDLPSTPTL
jgi:PAS domain S-box-containing protein